MADEAPSWIHEDCFLSYISTGSLLMRILLGSRSVNTLPIWYVDDPIGSEIIFVQFVSLLVPTIVRWNLEDSCSISGGRIKENLWQW